jgi:hypothetical protein
MPDHRMITQANLNHWWSIIKGLDFPILEMNAAALWNLQGCELALGLQPLPGLRIPDLPPSMELFAGKPAFKNLNLPDILILRKCLHSNENTLELSLWAETLLRFLEINQASLLKRARSQFGSAQTARQALLELTAFILDVYFENQDLRFLNLALKLIDLPGLLSVKSISKDLTDHNKLSSALYQVRILIMSEAALQQLRRSQVS